MTDKDKIALMKLRLHKLENNGRNVDSQGVVKKLRRKILKAEGAQS